MTPIAEFLTNLRSLGIEIWLGDGKLNYRAPQGTLTPELYAQLVERKQEIMAFCQKAIEVKNTDTTPIKPVARNGCLPLSSAQRRLWFLEQFLPGSLAYNVSGAFRLKGSLNVDALEQSLREIVSRHEILRTTFKVVDGEPTQAIASTVHLEMPVLDLQDIPEPQREAEILRWVGEECQRPFNLEFDPLLRASLLRCQPEEHVLLLNMHHIITDGWSMKVFVQEMSTLYEAFINKKAAVLPELSIQYADFAVWQQEWLQQEGMKAQLAYWKKQLAGMVNLLLPTDRPRPPLQSFRGGMLSIAIPQKLVQDLQSLARQENTSLSTVMLAAFQTLLYRYTQQEDIVVASPIANRNRSELERLIGFFVNTLVIRADLHGNPSFRALVRQVHQTTLEAYDHQDVPFERLVEELNPERDLSRNPLVQVSYAFQTIPSNPFELPELTISPLEYDRENTRYDLELHIWDSTEKGSNIFLYSKNNFDVAKVLEEEAALDEYSWSQETGGLNIIANYSKDLFEAPTVGRMLLHYLNLLKAIVTNPERQIADLPLLTKAEQQQLLTVWTKPHTDGCLDVIHRVFEAQVKRTPEALAAVFEKQEFTYRELNERANQLAHYLQKQGVVSEVCVGICLERSIDLVVGILAIIKAGGVYVPLNPTYPKQRLGLMIEDTQMLILLTKQALVDKLPNSLVHCICLEQQWENIQQESKDNLLTSVDPENLAYINYTSGSTGKPKGIGVCHRSVTNLVLGQNEIQIEATDRVAHISNVSFDALTFEVWEALLKGASIMGVAKDVLLSPLDLATTIAEYKISVMWLTVSVFNQMVKEAPEALKSLRCLIFGGEIANPQRVRQLLCEGAPPHLLNGYGPTETTTFATFYRVEQVAKAAESIPIGRPLSGVRCYILDDNWQPVPVGVAGEIYIGGHGLARGYLNRADLTAAKFIPDPFGDEPGGRLYRTGDLGRYLPDGNIEILKRLDNQVKIRGFRVEPEEVEAILRQHPDIQEAVVVVRERQGHDKFLVAYFVGGKVEDLRSYLRRQLPTFLLPAAFVPLKALPLTPNGKLDRQALPAPEAIELNTSDIVQPRTPTEEILVGVWSQVLKREVIGIHDNFFDLGGHSLLATQVVSRVQTIMNIKLPVRALFEAPTVAELAIRIEAEYQHKQKKPDKPLQPISRNGEMLLSFAQQRLWFIAQLVPDSPGYNIPTAYQLVGELKVDVLEKTLNEIVRRHETLRTNFVLQQGQPYQAIAPELHLNLNVIIPSGTSREEQQEWVRQLINEAALCPFDLSQEPLIRASVFRLTPEEHVLFLNMHHIISDGWSLGVFNREMEALYAALSQDKSSPLVELAVQYADFASWQRQWLQDGVLESQLAYWKRQLADLPLLRLYTDRPRPPVQTFLGKALTFKIPQHTSQALRQLSKQEGCTLFMTLLSAFNVLLCRYTGQEDIAVGSPIANRNHTEIEGLIGFFVNTLVIRSNLAGNPTFRELLRRVRETTLESYSYQDLPFERLVEELQPERDTSRNPLVQVVFALQNASAKMPELPNMVVTPMAFDIRTTRFDLECHLWETPEELIGTFIYNTELFAPDTASRMLEHFLRLLEAIATKADERIWEFPLLNQRERRQLLVDWNQAPTDYPQNLCIHEVFEHQALARPNAVALVFAGKSLTYAQLNCLANRLAKQLQAQGVESDVLVGVCMKRSPLMMVAMLAILKAGGAYLPLDPTYPKYRLVSIIEDTKPSVILTQEQLVSSLPESGATLICCELAQLASGFAENPVSQKRPENLAYVMYTSGSTGKPKGICVNHRAVIRLVKNPNYVRINPDDRFLQLAPFTFDASTFEIWGSLLNGGQLVIMPPHNLSLEELGKALENYRITIIFLTTALFHLMVEERLEDLKWLRQLLAGGEVMSVKHMQTFLSQVKGCQMLHVYGPTENTTFTSFYPVAPDQTYKNSIPIGRPISGTTIYILDRTMNPVPIGVPGELYIGGDGLARGYNQPELTAEKFVPHPFASQPGARLYKTGDLVRYLPDGNIEFLGRIDYQVKIRGFRIETGEIEAVLNQHPTVKESMIVPREESGDRRLVAYAILKPESEIWATPNVEHISQWQDLFDKTYNESAVTDEADFNIIGWNDSYTSQPIAPDAMREWVAHTVDSIMSHHPRRVLEIGCGTGLLLLRIAPHCTHYLGTDFSRQALDYVQKHLNSGNLSQVQLRQQMADDFTGIEPGFYDAVILNSIVQYFPGINYLLQVIEAAAKALAPGGIIFIGDVRCLPLLKAFHTSVQLYSAADSLSITQFRETAQRSMRFEEELVIDPAFFKALKQRLPEICDVQILHKRGTHHNELTKYRYDVLLRLGGFTHGSEDVSSLDWEKDQLNLPTVRQILERESVAYCIRQVPNLRVSADLKTMQLIDTMEDNSTIAEVRALGRELLLKDHSADPEEFWQLGEVLGYNTQVVWSTTGKEGYFDVLFTPQGQTIGITSPFMSRSEHLRAWHSYGNNPIGEQLTHQLVPQLRDYLCERLPQYMIPAYFVVLDAFPLNSSGKVNRRALPAPEAVRPDLKEDYQAPGTDIEQMIANIWKEHLRVEKVGVNDNFFDLGGHSLLLIQVFSKLKSLFDKELSVVDMFQYPTISAIAAYLSKDTTSEPERTVRDRIQDRASKRRAVLEERMNPRKN